MRRLVSNIRLTFGLFVLMGTGVILTFTHMLGNSMSRSQTHWGMVLSVMGLMFIFGIVVWSRSRNGQTADADAEAFYYLGFIYTLITLIATFYPLLTNNAPPSTQHVLGLFGLGLITTFVGLAGRVFFLQGTIIDPLEEGPRSLGNAYVEAARQIEATAIQIARTGGELEIAIKKSHDSVNVSIENANKAILGAVEKVIMEASNKVSDLSSETSSGIASLLKTTTDDMALTFDEIQEKLSALNLPSAEFGEQLQNRIETLIASISAVSASISNLNSMITSLAGIFDKTGSNASMVASGLTELTASAQVASRELVSANGAFDGLKSAASELTQAFGHNSKSSLQLDEKTRLLMRDLATLNQHCNATSSTIAGLEKVTGSATAPIAEFGNQVASVKGGLVQLLDVITLVESLISEVQKAQLARTEEIKAGVVTLRSYQEELGETSKRLTGALQVSEAAIRNVHENLVDATKFIISKVQ